MIKSEKQYKITKSKKEEFVNSLELLKSSENTDLLKDIMIDSLKSQIETFDFELSQYEILKNEKPQIVAFNIEELPEALIKARIIKGLSQKDLAQKTGMKEQQIQRYESTNYDSANFEKILSIAKSLNVSFEPTRLILKKEELNLKETKPVL